MCSFQTLDPQNQVDWERATIPRSGDANDRPPRDEGFRTKSVPRAESPDVYICGAVEQQWRLTGHAGHISGTDSVVTIPEDLATTTPSSTTMEFAHSTHVHEQLVGFTNRSSRLLFGWPTQH